MILDPRANFGFNSTWLIKSTLSNLDLDPISLNVVTHPQLPFHVQKVTIWSGIVSALPSL